MKNLALAVLVAIASAQALAENPTPTLADETSSVLVNKTQTVATAKEQVATQAVVVAPQPAAVEVSCETAKEVRLAPWQARRLGRQADRQEARDARDCCKCKCGSKKDCRTKALVLTKSRPACNCCN